MLVEMFAGLVDTLTYFLRVGSPAVTVSLRHVLQPFRGEAYIVLLRVLCFRGGPPWFCQTKRLLTLACKHNKIVSSTSSCEEF